MDKLTSVAASGMRSRIQALDVLANNLANVSSRGYKADREMYSLYSSTDAVAVDGQGQQQPWIRRAWTDFSQGVLQTTGNPSDIALSGPGFISVRGPSGTLYTRDGGLRLSPKGDLLASEDRPVLNTKNEPIKLDPLLPFEIDESGAVKQGGAVAAQMAIVEFSTPSELIKLGHCYFESAGGANIATPSTGTVVHQGKTESSNTGPAESSIGLIAVMRQFEMLQKAIVLGAEMNRRGVEDVARVNNS